MTVSNPVSFIFRQKIADVTVIDDDLGSSSLALSGEDADHFELVGTELFLTDGHPIFYGGEDAFQVTITADDPGIGHNLTDGPETGVELAVSVAQITVPGPDQVISWDADDEFLVNEVTASRQLDPDVAVLENGNLVMVWDSNIPGEDNEIQARIFDPSGTEVLGEFTVNQDSNFFQQIPRVVALADGGFVVTWQSHDTSNSETDQRDVRFRIFDEDGDDRTDELSAADETAFNQSRPDIAALEDGRFVITWTSSHPNADGSFDGIRAQTFDPDGSVSTDEFQVNGDGLNTPGTFWYQSDPVVTGLVGGGFAIAWSTGDLAADGESGAVKARIFDEDGIPVTNEVLVNGIIDGNKGFADVAATPGGEFVVTWRSDDQTQDDDSEHAIKARAFDANANPIDEEFLVNELTDLSQTSAAIAVLPDGSFAIVWDSAEPEQGDNSEEGIKARVFETEGTTPTGTPAYMLSLENNAETSFVYDPGAEAAAGDPADPVGQPAKGGSDDFV
jgi:hypothetical protein